MPHTATASEVATPADPPRYRIVVIAVAMLVNITIQMLWISYSTVAQEAGHYYGVATSTINWFSLIFMIAFLPLSIPASWLIDNRGLRFAVGLGSVMTAIGGLLRGAAGNHFGMAFAATVVVAMAQPLLLNCWTTVAGKWFARRHRALAVSLLTLASLLGTAIGGLLTPALLGSMSLAQIQLVFGAAAAVSAVLFVVLARDTPHGPITALDRGAGSGDDKAMFGDGIRSALRVPGFVAFLVCAFFCIGAYNAISTLIEQIITPHGFTKSDAGTLVALLIVGGLAGAVVLGPLSDRSRKRVPWVAGGLAVGAPFVLGFAYADTFWSLAASGFLMGFFLTGVVPVGMQYASEIAYQTPEGTTNGLIQLSGQLSFVLVLIMSAVREPDGSFTASLAGLAIALVLCALLMWRQVEPDPTHKVAGDLD